MSKDDIKQDIENYSNANDTDIICYFGEIKRDTDDFIINECRKRKLRKNVLLIISTYGGDPNAGYRFARCLQEAYRTVDNSRIIKIDSEKEKHKKIGNFSVFVDGFCKSAGTLICLGADKIIMSGNAELGPIDIQLRKKDEVGERESGLTPIQAVRFLEMQSAQMFKRHFISLRFQEELAFSTKMAAELATQLTVGLLSPIYAQIDPIRLAEVDRSMRIAKEYGERLKPHNLQEDALPRLLASYPSHGFVIDRGEARTIFKNVEAPTQELRKIGDYFKTTADKFLDKDEPMVAFLSSQKTEQSDKIEKKK